ncbi:BatD family protein [Actomonas aquatica]|uniref:BatD family protein n=1 Tax=Actomonas aquatica TaxID=2866162 RepID=A0ABZ1CBX1_9BACT|nr:BatD family protein [Opitutus sp. WL0086]WRQ89061.1 BatD family protein [Opitutus sp. WL0086]
MLGSTTATIAAEANVSATLTAPQETFWTGELFPLTFRTLVPEAKFQSMVGSVEWRSDNMQVEDWSEPEKGRQRFGTNWMATQAVTTRGYVPSPGRITLEAATQKVNIQSADRSVGFQQGGVVIQVPVASAPLTLTINPLPQPAPEGFSGAVGQFELTSTATTDKVNVGEAVTWTLELRGTGNWPQIRRLPARPLAKNFEVVSPGERRSAIDGKAFDAVLSEELSLVPRRPGNFTLPPVAFVYFDPAAGEYRTLQTPAHPLQVIGTATAAEEGMPEHTGVAVPDLPPPLPLDPSSGATRGIHPVAVSKWWIPAVAALSLPVVLWLALAARRRKLTDPLRGQREARARAMAILSQLPATGAPVTVAIRRQLIAWQEATATTLGLGVHPACGVPMQRALAASTLGTPDEWQRVWAEADAVIYGGADILPADWASAATLLLSATATVEPPLSAIFLRRNLWPSAVSALLVALALGAGAPRLQAAEDAGTQAYLAGDFVAAETAWAAAAAEEPLAVAPHYNRALALAQLDRWSESAMESLVALCLDPGDPAVRWQLLLSLDRSGIDQTKILQLAHRPGWYRVATHFSVGGWSRVFAAACFVVGLALAGSLWLFYGGRRGAQAGWPLVPAGLALAVALVAVQAQASYGALGAEETAIVTLDTALRSVPTEANAAQKTVPLPAGTLATAGRTFLGWTQLAFPNGQTGWVRSEELTYVYR